MEVFVKVLWEDGARTMIKIPEEGSPSAATSGSGLKKIETITGKDLLPIIQAVEVYREEIKKQLSDKIKNYITYIT